MKTIKEIIDSTPIYLHDWSDIKSQDEILESFSGTMDDTVMKDGAKDGVHILFASYTYEDYSGNAFVLFEKDGQLYEVNGSHCSCWGLTEGQWEPEMVNLEELNHRLIEGTFGQTEFADELRKFLNIN